jgi:hypothetical protein
MSGQNWLFVTTFGIIYLVLLFTLCLTTFRKGHWVLGLAGIFLPFLWIVGAVMPDRNGPTHTPRYG